MRFAKKILLEKNHTGIQFFKYVVCGGCAVGVDVVTFFLVAWLLFPALAEDDIMVRLFNMPVEPIDEHVRVVNFRICTGVAFIVSNLTAYILNVLFVFKAGRHSRWKELGLFYLVSGISIVIGMEAGAAMISVFGLSTSFSYVAKCVSATLINFAGRKFFIFHG